MLPIKQYTYFLFFLSNSKETTLNLVLLNRKMAEREHAFTGKLFGIE